MRGPVILVVSAFLIFSAACSDELEPLRQSSFERPERVAFACFETDEDGVAVSPRPAQECGTEDDRVLYALVTQTSRGEVAAVNLNRGWVIDSKPAVPGHTFVPVGEIPKAIVVPPSHPGTTYVANFGSRDVTAISTRAFLPGASAGETTEQRTYLGVGAVDMVVSPGEDALFLAAPDSHSVVRLSLCREPKSEQEDGQAGCTRPEDEGAITGVETLRLPAYTREQLIRIRQAVPDPETHEPYAYSCGFTFTDPEPTAGREPALSYSCASGSAVPESGAAGTAGFDAPAALDGGAADEGGAARADAGTASVVAAPSCDPLQPRPVALAVDASGEVPSRLLVADAASPVIHLIEIDRFSDYVSGSRSLPPPWVVGVPVRDVVVTPLVPAEIPVEISTSRVEDGTLPDAGAGPDAGEGFDAVPDGGAGGEAGLQADAGADASASGSGPPGGTSGSGPRFAPGLKQYAYAIDATDGSVLAIDARTGAVLPVSTAGARFPDRIPLYDAVATSLEVMTPDFEPGDGFVSRCNCVRAESVSGVDFAPVPRELQGVFLAVASRSGSVYVVDIHDKRAVDLRACRHSECLNEQGELILDADNDKPAPDLEKFFAETCTRADRCRAVEGEAEPYVLEHVVALDDERCRTCCNADETGTGFTEYQLTTDDSCAKCLDGQGEAIDFDDSRCRRCLDQEGNRVVVGIRRHRPRIANVLTLEAPLSAVNFIVDGQKTAVKNNGTTESVEEHRLCRIDCGSRVSMARSFPDPRRQDESEQPADEDAGLEPVDAGVEPEEEVKCEGETGDAFVCAGTEPWRSNGERWLASYEGIIPGSFDARGRLVLPGDTDNLSGRLEFRGGGGSFCSLGVLGADQQAPRPGDMLVIVSEPKAEATITRQEKDAKLDPADRFTYGQCEALTAEREDGYPPRIAFGISRSFDDRLELEPTLIPDRGPEGLSAGLLTYELVRYCMAGMLMDYEVRSRQSYTVVGDTSGFLHGVCVGEDGLCAACDGATAGGRAYEEQLFDNGVIAFRLAAQDERDPTFALEIRPGSVSVLSANIGYVGSYYYTYGTLPVELRYENASRTLFAVDTVLRGLVLIPLQPFPTSLLGATYIR
jgi:hypothetical protein